MSWRAGLRRNLSTKNACFVFGCRDVARSEVVFTARRTVFGAFVVASKFGRPESCGRVYDFRMSFVQGFHEVQNGKHDRVSAVLGDVLGGLGGLLASVFNIDKPRSANS